ncbi:MAG: 50S ribosomal protein L25/general stress protein Ctc [Alphaproteobacteria bacterium]|nr:50S ribosomal protein L25/general stress protein Ctc [Alphaproteobacteria bacterium]
MAEQVTVFAAKSREKVGKGNARELRRNEEVPAVIYGDKKPPLPISLIYKDLIGYVNKPSFFTTLLDIEVGGKKHRVLAKDVQFHPVTDRPQHIDFMRISAGSKTRVMIPVSFINADKCPGLKRGGTLNVVHHEIEVLCTPNKIPEKFEVSLDGYALGDAVHLSAIKLPEGVTFTSKEADYTIAAIAVPSALRGEVESETPAAEAAAAPADPKAKAAAPAAKAAAPAKAPPAKK